MAEEREDGQEDLERPPSFFPYDPDSAEPEPVDYGEPIEVKVEAVFAAQAGGQTQHFVVLSDGQGRKLPIVIGKFEAQAISLPLDNVQPDRPMTHDLVKTVLDRTNSRVDRVLIDDLLGSTYYAKLVLVAKDRSEMEIDCRPSDAIALAIRVSCPILVADGILDQAE